MFLPILLSILKFKPISFLLCLLVFDLMGNWDYAFLYSNPSRDISKIWMLCTRVFLMKGIAETTLIMVFTDVQRFVDLENEIEPFKQAEYYMNEGKEEIIIHSLS